MVLKHGKPAKTTEQWGPSCQLPHFGSKPRPICGLFTGRISGQETRLAAL